MRGRCGASPFDCRSRGDSLAVPAIGGAVAWWRRGAGSGRGAGGGLVRSVAYAAVCLAAAWGSELSDVRGSIQVHSESSQ
jgi:hypothetical protein